MNAVGGIRADRVGLGRRAADAGVLRAVGDQHTIAGVAAGGGEGAAQASAAQADDVACDGVA